jgi:HK97 family phage portal protein
MATRDDVAALAGGRTAGWYGRGYGLRPRSDWAALTGEPYPDRPYPATEAEAMGLPPFGRGVALLANAVAATAWHAVKWDAAANVNMRVADQPAVLTDPDPMTTPWNYRWAAVEDLILYGNHFALYGEPDYRTLRPAWLVPVPADDVWLIVDPETFRWNFTMGGTMVDPGDLLHASAGNRSGNPLGRGVLAQYGESLGGALAAETHAGSYFTGAALPPAVLQSPTMLTEDQAADLKQSWRDMTNTREPVVLPSGYVLTPVVSSAESAQLVESRQWNASAVAMMLGIPSYKLGLEGPSMTYQTVETADIDFVRDSVDRYASPLAEAFTKWLMPRGWTVVWDWASRMRADTKTTAEVIGSLVTSKVLTVDEARAMMGRPPMPESEKPAAPEILEPPEPGPEELGPQPAPDALEEVTPNA